MAARSFRRLLLTLLTVVGVAISGAPPGVAAEGEVPPTYTVRVGASEIGTDDPLRGMQGALYAWTGSAWVADRDFGPTGPDGSQELQLPAGSYYAILSDPRGDFKPTNSEAWVLEQTSVDLPGMFVVGPDTEGDAFYWGMWHEGATGSVTSTITGVVRRGIGPRPRGLDNVRVEAIALDGTEPAATAITYDSQRPHGVRHGYFEMWVPAGRYVVRVTDQRTGEDARFAAFDVDGGEPVTVRDHAESRLGSVIPPDLEPAHLSGEVLDESGIGINGIEVRAYRDGHWVAATTTRTDGEREGTFELWLDEGEWEIRYTDPEDVYADAAYPSPLVVTLGSEIALDPVTLSAGVDAAVSGLVQYAGGEPAAGVAVRLFRILDGGDDYRQVSDGVTGDDGKYLVEGARAERTYTVCAVVDEAQSCLGGTDRVLAADSFTIPPGTDVHALDEPLTLLPPSAVISNGTVALGVNPLGQLNYSGVGLQYVPTGNDSTFPGCECEGWGVADFTAQVSGYANNSSGISDNLQLVDFVVTRDGEGHPRTATSTVRVGNTFLVTHDYRPSDATDNAYEVNVTVKNISEAPVDLRYRRVMDWDVEPTAFDEYVTMETGDAEELVFTSNDGFASADPLAGPTDIGLTGEWTDEGPDDHGALFDFAFGELEAGASKSFQTYYGAAGTEDDAVATLAAVGAEAYSLGQPDYAGGTLPDETDPTEGPSPTVDTEEPELIQGPDSGWPNTFLFAFAGVGGGAVVDPPVANDDTLTVAKNGSGVVYPLENDTDPNGDELTLAAVESLPQHGDVLCGESACTYTPDTDYTGADSFTYIVSDGRLGSDVGTVTVDVTGDAAGTNTAPPVIGGTPKVGSALTASTGTWEPAAGLAFSYRWLRGGEPIATATSATYTATVADLGEELSVEVTAAATGRAPVTATSDVVVITLGEAAVSEPGQGPTVDAPVRFGERATARPGIWTPTPGRFAYQWLRDGESISGATSSSYLPTVEDVGSELSVRVTARTRGYADGTAASNAVKVAPGAAPVNLEPPRIDGIAAEGYLLEAREGRWDYPWYQLDLAYEWLADGEPIDGATGTTFEVTDLADGTEVTLRVTASRPGHGSAVAVSDALVVGAVAGVNTTLPTITGTAQVGQTLTYAPGSWDPADLDVSHVWYASYWANSDYRFPVQRGGTTLRLADWMSGLYLSVEETVSSEGTAPATAVSAAAGPVKDLPLLSPTRYPELDRVRAGEAVTVDTGSWQAWSTGGSTPASGLAFQVDWYVDYRLVDGQHGTTFTPSADMGGKYLYAVVRATKDGHRDGWASTSTQRIRRVDEGEGTLRLTVQRSVHPFTRVADTSVTVCDKSGWNCANGVTDTNGQLNLTLDGTDTGVDYDVWVYPPYSTGLLAKKVVASVKRGEVTSLVVNAEAPTPIPDEAELVGTIGEREVDGGTYPVVVIGQSSTLTVEGCASIADPRWTVTFASGATPMHGELVETPGVGGVSSYSAVLPGYTSTGMATVSTNVTPCDVDDPVEFSLYIDPSGVVTDQYGRSIAGAEVTLLRRDGADFVPVPDGSPVMSPDNRHNPSYTDGTGFFRWDVSPGDYRVSVTSATQGGQPCTVATTDPMAVPPPRLDLLIKVQCSAPAPSPTTAPSITGTPRVNEVLSVSNGVWGDGLVVTGVEWLRGGTVVGTGSTYRLVAADQGQKVTARVTARRPDYVQENGTGQLVSFTPVTADVVSATIAAAPPAGGGGGGTPATAPVNTDKPTITGTAKVGQTLTATPGTWNTEGLTFGYQWLRDGEAIAGATGTRYVAAAADRTHGLSVRVTASKTGMTNGSADSVAVTVEAGDAPMASAPPVITGDPEVGETLSASEGTWDLTGLTFGYQWERDGEPIAGATSSTYQVVEADRGGELTVVVTASKPGYADGTATSAGVDVPEAEEPPVDPEPVATTTSVRLLDRVVRLPERGTVKVRVVREDGEAAVGRIAVKVDGKIVAERRVRQSDDGRVTVKLPKLKRGVHKVRVVFTGGEGVESSTSDRVLLKVRPAKPHGGSQPGGHRFHLPAAEELFASLWG